MRRGIVLPILAVALITGACGSSVSASSKPAQLLAPASPSTAAKMICEKEASDDIAATLGVKTTSSLSPTWINGVYSCRYQYPDGVMVLSVNEFKNDNETTNYFNHAEASLGTRRTIEGLGAGAFQTNDGSVVVRKDFKVLDVDVRSLPDHFGQPSLARGDAATSIAEVIMGCWAG